MDTTRKTLTVTIDLENATFADGFGEFAVAELLHKAAALVEGGALHTRDGGPLTTGQSFDLRDPNSNGGAVGSVKVEEV